MKLLLENWRQYLNEAQGPVYYWQTQGPWKRDSQIDFGKTHVPKAKPRPQARIEEIFEEVRRSQFPSRPSRLNCVFLCENFDWNSFCNYRPDNWEGNETYVVELRGEYSAFKTDAEYWTQAINASDDEARIERLAAGYWSAEVEPTVAEVLVSPPEAAIIVGKYEE